MTALVYLRFYGSIFKETGKSLVKAWWVAFLPIGLSLAALLSVGLLVSLLGGTIGGILAGFLLDAAVSSYLYFLGSTVDQSKVSLREFPQSFKAFFWPVISVYFVYWIANLLLAPMLQSVEKGNAILIGLTLVAFIAFNAAPEVLYQQRSSGGGLATLQTAFKFLQENLLTWGVPNALIAGGIYLYEKEALLRMAMDSRTFGLTLFSNVLLAVLLHGVMVFRGHLFKALAGSSHRQRMFKFRNA